MSSTNGSSTQNSNGAPAPTKRRNRKAVSCVPCREKKIKCDRVVPCIQCSKRGEQHLCRIEQKAKSASANVSRTSDASKTAFQPAQSSLSPGSLAYNQFSAAITNAKTQVDAAQMSDSPPPAEVEAIKARLAQVEAMLAGQFPISSASSYSSASPPSSSNWNNYRSNSNTGTAASQYSSSSYSPHSIFAANRSTSNALSSQHVSVSPLGLAHDTDESSEEETEEEDESLPSISPVTSRRDSPINYLNTQSMPVSRKEMDSDTEDAATVLERLAMSTDSQTRWQEGACPSQGKSGSKLEAAVGAKFEQCLKRDQEVGLMAEETGEKFERCLKKQQEGTNMAEDVTSSKSADVHALSSSCTVPTSAGSAITGMVLPPIDGMSGEHSQADDDEFPMCACRSTNDGHQHEENTAIVNDQAGLLACLTKHQPLSTEPAPITVPCRLACENKGLLRLKSGPETLFGWGMGWAWSAADVLLQKEQLKAHEENRHFVVTPRTEREAVLRAVCESLPSKDVAMQLIEVYESRVRYLSGHVVHIPCLKREMEAFYALDSAEKRARVVNHVDPGWLGMLLGVLTLGLRFYPCWPKPEWKPVNHLFDGKTIHAWHSAAKTCLVLAGLMNSTSISVVQAILLLYLYNSVSGVKCGGESDTGTTCLALLRIAITNAQEMGLHRLGDIDKQSTTNEPSSKVIRREIAKRIWWALVFRDWSAAGTGCSKDYIIRAESFNTPFPGNYNDEDLMMTPLPKPRPREEFTEMSYVLSNLEFGVVVKDDVDVRLRRELYAATNGEDRRLTCAESRKLDVAYRAVLENAPSFFKVGSEIGRVTCVEVQRWLLQQAVFSKLLRIHRPNLSSRKESRTNCVLLARSILDMQKKIRSRCTVIDRLWVNLMQSFSAAIVLALHLLHTRQTLEHRVSVRSEITEAIRALKQVDGNDCAAKKCIRVIEALLEEEEERWQAGNDALSKKDDSPTSAADQVKHKRKRQADTNIDEIEAGNGSGRRKNLYSLAQRVALAAQGKGTPQQSQNTAQPQQDDKSKRQATIAAVQAGERVPNPAALIAQIQNQYSSNSASSQDFNINGVSAMKDDASRQRMDAMTLPTFGSSTNGRPDDVPFPDMMPRAVHHNAAFDFGVSSSQEAGGRMAAPNGVDLLMMNNSTAPADGQAFDLAAFLEQCENSPSSSADDSLLSANDEHSATASSDYSGSKGPASVFANSVASGDNTDTTSVSSFGEGSLTQEAIQKQQQQLRRGDSASSGPYSSTQASSPTNPASVNPSTDMDTFWNWIITQGANGINANPGAANPSPATFVHNTGNNASAQVSSQSAYNAPTQATGLTPFLGSNGFFQDNNKATNLPSQSPSRGTSFTTYPATDMYSNLPKTDMPSVGTPSSGFGLDTFLGAPLYDFTDFANAWTASNPNAPTMPGSSQGPISDP